MQLLVKIMTILFLLSVSFFKVNAQNNGDESSNQVNSGTNTSSSTGDIELNGQIGPYDPTESDPDGPNFDKFQDDDLEGILPTKDNYYTIAVTVPTSLDFSVLEHEINVKGQFYSPKYTIKNNATRPIHISVGLVHNVIPTEGQDEYIPLYLEKPIEGDGKVQIDLNLSLTNLKTSAFHNVNLTNLKESDAQTFQQDDSHSNYLGVLGLKEQGILHLNSDSWDRPLAEGLDKNAQVNFDIQLVFSLDDPTSETN